MLLLRTLRLTFIGLKAGLFTGQWGGGPAVCGEVVFEIWVFAQQLGAVPSRC